MTWGATLRLFTVLLASVTVCLLIVAGTAWLIFGVGHLDVTTRKQVCRWNLMNISGLLMVREADGKLEYQEGGAFLLQVWEDIRPERRKVFRCPESPDGVHISYRGPDATALEHVRSPGGKSVLIACDANGENGDEPHHDDGVCVLWSSGKVEFIRWEEMEGYDGDPVKVGPGSPDPRFRHLVR